MAVFESDQQLYAVLDAVFARVAEQPANIDAFTRSNLVIRMIFTDPAAEVLIDGRQPPLEVFFGPRPGQANLEFIIAADLLHEVWIGRESSTQAVFSGRIKTRGNLMKAMQLMELFRECERVYPAVAAQFKLGQ